MRLEVGKDHCEVLSSGHAVVVVAVNLAVLLPVQDSQGPAPSREW